MKSYKQLAATQHGTTVRAHVVLWETFNGPIPKGMQIDHINGDATDNTLTNLRLVTRQENQRNLRTNRRNKSGIMGVGYRKDRNKWRAFIGVGSKQVLLGHYTDWFDAVCARMSANNQYGFHENHGRR